MREDPKSDHLEQTQVNLQKVLDEKDKSDRLEQIYVDLHKLLDKKDSQVSLFLLEPLCVCL